MSYHRCLTHKVNRQTHCLSTKRTPTRSHTHTRFCRIYLFGITHHTPFQGSEASDPPALPLWHILLFCCPRFPNCPNVCVCVCVCVCLSLKNLEDPCVPTCAIISLCCVRREPETNLGLSQNRETQRWHNTNNYCICSPCIAPVTEPISYTQLSLSLLQLGRFAQPNKNCMLIVLCGPVCFEGTLGLD